MTSSVFGFCLQTNGVHISIGDVACATSDSSPDIMKVHLHHLNPTQTRIINLASFLCLPSPHTMYLVSPRRPTSSTATALLFCSLFCHTVHFSALPGWFAFDCITSLLRFFAPSISDLVENWTESWPVCK